MTGRQQREDEQAHDILAAEEFAMPVPDPALHHVKLPADPSGNPDAHDILAAEEFAMPAPTRTRGASTGAAVLGSRSRLTAAVAGGAGLLGAILLRRRRT